MREIVLDTETTGLDPGDGHRIVEIGAVEIINYMPTGQNFHEYINPQRDMPDEAFKVHGLSQDFLSGKPLFRDVVEKFLNFIADSPLVIHNAAFDMRFINHELKKTGKEPLVSARAVDSLDIARKRFPGMPNNLDALCKRFGVDLSKRKLHGALLDCELLAEVYLHLKGGRQIGFSYNTPERRSSQGMTQTERKPRPLRYYSVPEKEYSHHRRFLESIKNPIWLIDE